MIGIDAKLSGDIAKAIDNFADGIKKNVLRAGAQAAAQEFYNEAKLRCPVSETGHWFYGTHQKYWFPRGTLRDSIYQVYSKDNSAANVQTYHVAWNHQKAPYGFMVEYGTSHAPAHPFLRPAYESVKTKAGKACMSRMESKIKEVKP